MKKFGIKITSKKILILIITSKWCNSCKGLTLILQKLRDEGLIDLININLDENPLISQFLDITTIPSLFFFKNGVLMEKDIEVYDYTYVKKGVMTGFTCENLLKDIIKLI